MWVFLAASSEFFLRNDSSLCSSQQEVTVIHLTNSRKINHNVLLIINVQSVSSDVPLVTTSHVLRNKKMYNDLYLATPRNSNWRYFHSRQILSRLNYCLWIQKRWDHLFGYFYLLVFGGGAATKNHFIRLLIFRLIRWIQLDQRNWSTT